MPVAGWLEAARLGREQSPTPHRGRQGRKHRWDGTLEEAKARSGLSTFLAFQEERRGCPGPPWHSHSGSGPGESGLSWWAGGRMDLMLGAGSYVSCNRQEASETFLELRTSVA
jgi:hypothetical protein